MTLTPEEAEKVALKKGLLAFSYWFRDLTVIGADPIEILRQIELNLYLIKDQARQEKAAAVHKCTTVVKCPHCIGNGSIVISAGDGEWSDDCETCKATGFVPLK